MKNSFYSEPFQKKVKQGFFSLLQEIGFELDKDLGLVQTKIISFPEIDYYKMLVFLNKNNLKSLAYLFLLILCVTLTIPPKLLKFFNLPIIEPIPSEPTKFNALTYNGNSCYLDSTLLCLLLTPNELVEKYILNESEILYPCNPTKSVEKNAKYLQKIRNELIKIDSFFHSTKTKTKNCKKFRKSIRKCLTEFHTKKTQDAGEFLQFLFRIFSMEFISKQITYTYGSNNMVDFFQTSTTIDTSSPIIIISTSVLEYLDDRDYTITEFVKQKDVSSLEGWKYNHKIQIVKRIPDKLAIFYVNRKGITFNKTKIYPAETLFTPNYSHLDLTGIVIHHNDFEHYTAIVKNGNSWYNYNDIGTKIVLIGTYNDMIEKSKKDMSEKKPNPITHGTLYFYS